MILIKGGKGWVTTDMALIEHLHGAIATGDVRVNWADATSGPLKLTR